MFLWHPDGYIRIGDKSIALARWRQLEPASVLPAGAAGLFYKPGVAHNIIAANGYTQAGPLPWPDGDRYIQKAVAGVYSIPADPAIAIHSASVEARAQRARDSIAAPATGFMETLRTGDVAAVGLALDSVSDADWRAAVALLLVALRDAAFAEQLEA